MSDSSRTGQNQYQSLLTAAKDAFNDEELERSLEYAAVAASLARDSLVRWYDEELESLLVSIGDQCISEQESAIADDGNDDDLRITYLATFLSDHGGHSETLRMWTKMLGSRQNVIKQDVVLTNQHNGYPQFPTLEAELTNHDVSIEQLAPDASYTERIQNLGTILRDRSPDRVIMFINPEDVIAVSTLGSLKSTPHTIFYNHADHVYWLGRCVIDDLVEYRSVGQIISHRFRDIQSRCVVPLTTDVKNTQNTSPLLDLDTETVSVSIGSQYKIEPNLGVNYFCTIGRVLEQNPQHSHLLVTTQSVENHVTEYIPPKVRDRFYVRGPLSNLDSVYHMTDIILDTIPYSGGMIRLEALAYGIPMVVFDSSQLSFLPNADIFNDDYPYITNSTEEYIRYATELLEDRAIRRKTHEWMLNRFGKHFSPNIVGERLSSLVIHGQTPPDWTGRDSNASTFNPDVYACHLRSRPRVNKRLMIFALKKQSPRHLIDRLSLYRNAVTNRELETVEEIIGYLGLSLFGYRFHHPALTVRDIVNQMTR